MDAGMGCGEHTRPACGFRRRAENLRSVARDARDPLLPKRHVRHDDILSAGGVRVPRPLINSGISVRAQRSFAPPPIAAALLFGRPIIAEAKTSIITLSGDDKPDYKGATFMGRPMNRITIKSDQATFIIRQPDSARKGQALERFWDATLQTARDLRDGKEWGASVITHPKS